MLNRRSITFLTLYFVFLIVLQALTNFSMRLSYLIPLLFPLALAERNAKRFLIEWWPFYLIILLYDSLRGFADELGHRVHYEILIQAERLLCAGQIPSVWFQEHWSKSLLEWQGQILMLFYFGHFLLPIFVCYVLWKLDFPAFKTTTLTLAAVSVFAFVTFLIFPAAPPWLAAQEGYLPPIKHVLLFHLQNLGNALPRLYIQMNPNLVAAMPSLHAAYPLVLWLCVRKIFPRAQVLFFLNILVVAFTIVVFGEHYVIDILAGWLYAGVAYVWMASRKFSKEPTNAPSAGRPRY